MGRCRDHLGLGGRVRRRDTDLFARVPKRCLGDFPGATFWCHGTDSHKAGILTGKFESGPFGGRHDCVDHPARVLLVGGWIHPWGSGPVENLDGIREGSEEIQDDRVEGSRFAKVQQKPAWRCRVVGI